MMKDLSFAFNDKDFSDRELHIEIMPDWSDSEGSNLDSESKPRRKNKKKQNKSNVKKHKGEIKTLYMNSLILASHSPFFFKLFKNGMRESTYREATLQINASEEASLMDLLKYMYTNTLSAATVPDLLKVLMLADKFEVTSCLKHCCELLQVMPLSLESAVLYLELPPSVLMDESAKALPKLRDASQQYLINYFKDFTKPQQEKAMDLSLSALEVVLGINGLKVISEDHIYDFILKWGRARYPKVRERREILTKRLLRFIYFPYMSSKKLNEVLDCPDFIRGEVSKLVLEGLHFNAGFPYGHGVLFVEDSFILKRVYHHHPIKVVHLKSPLPRCAVFFNLTKDEMNLLGSKCLISQFFCLGGTWFYLSAQCYHKHLNLSSIKFDLHVFKELPAESWTIDCEISLLKKEPSMEFKSMFKFNNVSVTSTSTSWQKLLGTPGAYLMIDKCEYFVDGILHLRADLTLNNNSQA